MFLFRWLVMTVNYLEDLKDLFVTVMEARDPVDLFILPGDIFNPAHNYLYCIVLCCLTSIFILGLAFDRCGRRLGRSGGWVVASSLQSFTLSLFTTMADWQLEYYIFYKICYFFHVVY